MKLFQITNITIIDPITVAAHRHEDAATYFVESLHRAFGRVPLIDYAVAQWNPRNLTDAPTLQTILDRPYRGFAWERDHGWDFVDPFAERA